MAHLRLVAPFRELGIDIIEGMDENGLVDVELVHEGDIVILQRNFPVKFNEYQRIVELARQEGKPTVFELDDLLFYLPETHPDRQYQLFAPTLLPMLQTLMDVDLVIVTTEMLRDLLDQFNPNVVVIENYFDEQLWQLIPPVPKASSPGKLTIGYMGSLSHRPDLDYITPILLELINLYPERIQLHFWGTQPPVKLVGLPQVRWTSNYFFSYTEFAEFFQSQTADIFIAPLADNLFNRCKSSLKFFEYSALGSPGVYSRLEPYSQVVIHQENGMLASSLEEWCECLIQLIEDDELRFQLASNAQTTIRNNWLLSRNAYRWDDAIQKAFDLASRKRQPGDHITSILESINTQLFETFTKKEADERAMKAQLAEQDIALQAFEEEVNELNTEILGYVLSKSWQITRPFRMVSRKLNNFSGKKNV
jgi:glycosyltransferase involved in cell wall biosynthesis